MKEDVMRKLERQDDNSTQSGGRGIRTASGRAALMVMVCALLALAVGGSAKAVAQPTGGSMQLRVLPIPVELRAAHGASYPGTGNVLGEGFALEANVQITGDEYGGFPPPLTSVTAYAPAGATLDMQGFPICPQAILESHEVGNCPQGSLLANGSVSGVVSFGADRVHETLSLQAFFDGAQKIAYYAEGTSPALVEILGSGTITAAGGAFSHQFNAVVPLVETVPEAPYAVAQSAHLILGVARKQGSHLIPLMKLPKSCPKGGLPIRVRLGFLIGAPVQMDTELPCPARR
jgi:hypothetical protein